MARKIIGGILIVISILVLAVEFPTGNLEPIAPAVIFIVVGLVLLFRKPKSRAEKAAQKAVAERRISGTHFAGLPLAEGAAVSLDFLDQEVEITGGGNAFSLPYSKITDMSIKTDTEIQKAYVSSTGGAIAGAALFGTVGAMIGGRVKEKTTTKVAHYLMITYQKDGTPDYVAFQVFAVRRAQGLIADTKAKWGAGERIAL